MMRLCLGMGLFAGMLALASPAQADFSEGQWRLELQGANGFDSGSTDRSDDQLYGVNIEYEFPVLPRATLGLRLYPTLIYDGPDTVWAGGGGLSFKAYQKKDEYRGFFFELNTAALYNSPEFVGNTSEVNFLSGGGVGYQFNNNWHVTAKLEHISNAGLGDRNQGINLFGLAFGVRF